MPTAAAVFDQHGVREETKFRRRQCDLPEFEIRTHPTQTHDIITLKPQGFLVSRTPKAKTVACVRETIRVHFHF